MIYYKSTQSRDYRSFRECTGGQVESKHWEPAPTTHPQRLRKSWTNQVYRLHQKPDAQRELWQGPVRHDESVLRPTAGGLTCQKRTQKQVPQDVEMNMEISKFHSHKSSLSETESVFKK